MYGMKNSGNLFADELTKWLLEAGFIQYTFQMSIYYKYKTDGKKMLFYIMLMTLSTVILLNILENTLWVL